MMYFHFKGCGACIQMEKTTFKDKNVIPFFNTNFINFEVNTLEDNVAEILKIHNVRMQPTFLFFDPNGNELHKMVGFFSPQEFQEQATNAVKNTMNLSNYKKLYSLGKREPDFLFDYAYMLRDAFELDSTLVNEYLNSIDKEDYKQEKNIKFIYEFCIYNFSIFLPYNNPRFEFMLNNKELFYTRFDSVQVKARIIWILDFAIHKAIDENDEQTFRQGIQAIKDFDRGESYNYKELDGRITGTIGKNQVLYAMLCYYDKMGVRSNYSIVLNQYLSKLWDDADALNNFAWDTYEKAKENETEKIQAGLKSVVRSIELDNIYESNDTYAWLLYKSGEKEKALIQAQKAIEIAKKNSKNYRETSKLIELIESEK